MTKTYKVRLADGGVITLDGVASVEKDGSGLRLKGADGAVIASFDDGQSKACWPAGAAVETPAPVEPDDGN